MNSKERNELIDALLEGRISEADFLRLEAELSVDPAARREYYDRLHLTILLENEAKNSGSEPAKVIPFPATNQNRWYVFAAMAALFMVLLGIWFTQNFGTQPPMVVASLTTEETASGFGVITAQANTAWKDSAGLANGALVRQGLMQLTAGVARLELFSGVSVIVEGDAAFEVISPMEMRVARGKVRVRVPEAAHGFRIHTAEGEVVDLGTEFALAVTPDKSEIHVIEGEVEWHPRADNMFKMAKGEAVYWQADGRHQKTSANPAVFVGTDELGRQLASSQQARRQEWEQASAALRHDARLVAYYRMNVLASWDRVIPNESLAGADGTGNGAIVAASRTLDRWGNPEGALGFSPAGSRVRVSIPGEFASLTMYCWVKINSLDRLYNSLFLTDGHNLGAPHWQITNDGRLFFSVKKYDRSTLSPGSKDKYNSFSRPFWNPALSGQWLMLAVTYDVNARRVTHYLNGEVIGSETIPDEFLVEKVNIGNASICNWSEPVYRKDAEFTVRNLNGSMDEFALLRAALSENEIQEIYQHGRP